MDTRTREVLLYRDSSDNKVSSAGRKVKTGRKWKAHKAVNQAEARLQNFKRVETLITIQAGLKRNPRTRFSKVQGKGRQQLILNEVRAAVREARCIRSVEMWQQGAWT